MYWRIAVRQHPAGCQNGHPGVGHVFILVLPVIIGLGHFIVLLLFATLPVLVGPAIVNGRVMPVGMYNRILVEEPQQVVFP